ncbi:glyoxalase/bleomycin resistance/dioxygenase family protein [Leptolyngbya sp. BL0902]|uniref:VOC family protein n=1 Tax=Leptolyngbya sp. BL0902 TaxID=1115757 RepID=UPI0018E7EFDB|nr:VOC family protein [Leptolyngbya sp. BL0902]QQE67075.1 glyoxalase/bleomycin resistance/dioxygenase family protein [Leptolyngbya sp. BL0902]
MFSGVAEVMYFVSDPKLAAEWYSRFFDIEITVLANPDYFFVKVGEQEVWFHQADDKVPSGVAGHVAYWQVDDFDAVLERAITLGAVLYRGPLDRKDGSYMCQVKDPFGNLIGFIGPSVKMMSENSNLDN